MKYVVCVLEHSRDEQEWFEEDYDGENPSDYFARKYFYGGDENGIPSDYIKDVGNYLIAVYACPVENMLRCDVGRIRNEHVAYHDKIEEREIRERELVELARLKAKYGTK